MFSILCKNLNTQIKKLSSVWHFPLEMDDSHSIGETFLIKVVVRRMTASSGHSPSPIMRRIFRNQRRDHDQEKVLYCSLFMSISPGVAALQILADWKLNYRLMKQEETKDSNVLTMLKDIRDLRWQLNRIVTFVN